MSSKFDMLLKKGLISPPSFLRNNVVYEVITGSYAYGTNQPGKSDFDIYGVGIPLKEIVFPHLTGQIEGFGKQAPKFEQFQQHHNFVDKGTKQEQEYDITIYNIVKYFQLCMENNPNMVDTLFVPQECITHINAIGSMIRENRKMFLHKGSYYKFLGYAHSQLNKMKSVDRQGKRKELYELYNFDVKFAMHLVRLSYECEQILLDGDLDLRKNNEHLKAIRRGDVKEEDIRAWFAEKEKYLEKLYHESKLQHSPDETLIKQLLINCLEHHFGSLEKCIIQNADSGMKKMLNDIQTIMDNGAKYLK